MNCVASKVACWRSEHLLFYKFFYLQYDFYRNQLGVRSKWSKKQKTVKGKKKISVGHTCKIMLYKMNAVIQNFRECLSCSINWFRWLGLWCCRHSVIYMYISLNTHIKSIYLTIISIKERTFIFLLTMLQCTYFSSLVREGLCILMLLF